MAYIQVLISRHRGTVATVHKVESRAGEYHGNDSQEYPPFHITLNSIHEFDEFTNISEL